MFKIIGLTIFVFLLSFLTGCYQQIGYDTFEIKPLQKPCFPINSISISIPKDHRRDKSVLKRPLFLYNKNTNSVCYNLEAEYGRTSASNEIARSLANHLKALSPQTRVFTERYDSTEYKIEFTLNDFSCYAQKTDHGNYQSGLLITALETAIRGQSSRFEYHIVYADIKVFNKKKGLIFSLPKFASEEIINIPEIINCSQVYWLISERLMLHNNEFIQMLCDSLNSK